MSVSDFSGFKSTLQAQQAELNKSIAELESYEDSDSVELATTLRETLADIERALAKIPSTYGACENCGKWIGEERLQEMPAARYCVDCAAKL